MDPKFVKLLAEHTFCLCFDNQGSCRASSGLCIPRRLAALGGESEKGAVTSWFTFGQGQLAEKKEQNIRDPSKNAKLMWYPVKARDLNLSVCCHYLSQLLTNAVWPHPALTGYIHIFFFIYIYIYIYMCACRKHRWMSAQQHQGLELLWCPVCAACQKGYNLMAQARGSEGKLIQNG